jgi:hypothetical protein
MLFPSPFCVSCHNATLSTSLQRNHTTSITTTAPHRNAPHRTAPLTSYASSPQLASLSLTDLFSTASRKLVVSACVSYCVSLIAGTGIPPGVVNLINGTGIMLLEPLCGSTIPRLLTTIGSTAMGKRMMQYGASSIKRFSLELGGDAPVLVRIVSVLPAGYCQSASLSQHSRH